MSVQAVALVIGVWVAPWLAGARVPGVEQQPAPIPDAAYAAYDSGLEALEASSPEDALRHFQEAVALAPDYYDALNRLGIEYLKAGRSPEARDMFERARRLNGNDPWPLVNLGTIHFQEGQALELAGDAERARRSFQTAAELLEEAVRLDPLVPASNFYLGSAVYELDQYDRAEFLLFRALQLDPLLHEARLPLVNVYAQQRRYAEALDEIARYLEANPDSSRRQALEAMRAQLEGLRDSGR